MALRVGFEHAKALIVRLLGVVAGKIDQRALCRRAVEREYARARRERSVPAICSESKSSSVVAIFKIDGNVEIARDVGLADVELLQQGREEFAGIE